MPLPAGRRLAVSIGVDFDAHSVWVSLGRGTPGPLSRGEFGARVGVPRLLALLARYDIRTTFFVPAHTMSTFPAAVRSVMDAGHEIAAHGYCHERAGSLDVDTERRLMAATLARHEKFTGTVPRGHRAPAWDFSQATLGILEENGFAWDSSLMGDDFYPYHPRPVTCSVDGDRFGPPSPVLELPVSWHLDDFPALDHLPGAIAGLGDTDTLLRRWREHFDYAYAHAPGGMLAVTVHPQTIGRAHAITMLERLLDHIAGHDGVWWATLSQIEQAWRATP